MIMMTTILKKDGGDVMTLLHDMMLHDDASYCHLMMALTATFAA